MIGIPLVVIPTEEESNQHLLPRDTVASCPIGPQFDPSSVGMTPLLLRWLG